VFEAWTNVHKMHFHRKLPFRELDYAAIAIDACISHRSKDNQTPK
jgi:hypothetical protein